MPNGASAVGSRHYTYRKQVRDDSPTTVFRSAVFFGLWVMSSAAEDHFLPLHCNFWRSEEVKLYRILENTKLWKIAKLQHFV